MKKLSLLMLTAFVLAGVINCYATSSIELKMATFLPRQDRNLIAWWPFIKAVNEKAKGELKIKYVGGPEAVPSFKQFEALRSGVLDMIFGCESYYGRQVTGFAYTHLSRLTPWEERQNGYYDFRLQLLKKHGVFYLGRPLYGTWFHVFTNKFVRRPQELKGQKIRVSATYEPFIRRLGAVPITLPGSDVYTALERGTIDGYCWAVLGNIQMGWHEVCKYILEPRIYSMNLEALINLRSWNKLPDHLKQLLKECMIENEKKYSRIVAEVGEQEYAEMQQKGMKVLKFSPEDTKWYVELAYEAGWDEVLKSNPTLGQKLRKLLSPEQ